MDSTVVCVYKTGGDYDKRYVDKLYQSAMKHGAQDFVCLTDDLSLSSICEVMPLEDNFPGWWSKIELFKLTYGQYVYFDLDTIIHNSIKSILNYSHDFTMLKGFSGTNRPASGVMAWQGDYSHIYYDFNLNMIDKFKTRMSWGDQGYIAQALRKEPQYFQELFPGLITSRKFHSKDEINKSSVLCYHGKPRPADTGWSL